MLKRVLGINKKSRTAEIFKTLKIRELLKQIYVMKLKLINQLKENEITRKLIQEIEKVESEKNTKLNTK